MHIIFTRKLLKRCFSCGRLLAFSAGKGKNTKMSRPQVYLTRGDIARIIYDMLEPQCDVTAWKEERPVPRNELLKSVVGKSGIFCTILDQIDVEVLNAAGENLKVISTYSVGYNHIDVAECKKRNIRVGYTPNVLTDSTAELAVALLLATGRRLIEGNHDLYNGRSQIGSPIWMCGQSIKNSTVGIIGFGRIGQAIGSRIAPFLPKEIVYSNRSDKSAEAALISARKVTYDELFSICDFIILSCTLNPDTMNLINSDAISKMKSSAIIINISRGEVLDQVALCEALKSGKILAAGLDVTTPEPLPLDHPLLKLKNCVILPHLGAADVGTRTEMAEISARNILGALTGTEMYSELSIP